MNIRTSAFLSKLANDRAAKLRARNRLLGELIAGDSKLPVVAPTLALPVDPSTLFALHPEVLSFCIVDLSTSKTAGPTFGGPITVSAQQALVAALSIQLNEHVSPYYGGAYRVRFAAPGTNVGPLEVSIAIVDDAKQIDPNAPSHGAEGGHSANEFGIPMIFVSRAHSNSILSGMLSLLALISHEVCETVGDPSTNTLADDMQDFEWAREICDSVQEDGYELAEIPGATLANFVLPSYWNPYDKRGPWDFAKLCTSSFSLRPGGYAVRRPKGGGDVQIHGEIGDVHLARKMLPTSRTVRRGAFGGMT